MPELLVGVEIKFKPFDPTTASNPASYFGYGPANETFKRLAENKRPFHTSGVFACHEMEAAFSIRSRS